MKPLTRLILTIKVDRKLPLMRYTLAQYWKRLGQRMGHTQARLAYAMTGPYGPMVSDDCIKPLDASAEHTLASSDLDLDAMMLASLWPSDEW